MADWLQAVASISTAIVAVAALLIAMRAPEAAARFAEKYRSDNQAEEEKTRIKVGVFVTLMQHRALMLAPNAVAAVNLIDVAFVDSPRVRDAHKSFMAATAEDPFQPEKTVERYHALIEAVARDLGFMDRLSVMDLRTAYYPAAMGKFDEAAFAEAEEKIARRQAAKLAEEI